MNDPLTAQVVPNQCQVRSTNREAVTVLRLSRPPTREEAIRLPRVWSRPPMRRSPHTGRLSVQGDLVYLTGVDVEFFGRHMLSTIREVLEKVVIDAREEAQRIAAEKEASASRAAQERERIAAAAKHINEQLSRK